jgi:hypothetical protein
MTPPEKRILSPVPLRSYNTQQTEPFQRHQLLVVVPPHNLSFPTACPTLGSVPLLFSIVLWLSHFPSRASTTRHRSLHRTMALGTHSCTQSVMAPLDEYIGETYSPTIISPREFLLHMPDNLPLHTHTTKDLQSNSNLHSSTLQ